MSDPANFAGTVTGGIQDISAILPLLGTEQCEKHVGSTLDGGFLYSSATPISIFGSLGAVRAAFNVLVVSLNITHFRVLGARLLSNGGFSPSGTVAPMIALDPKHPKRFLAETRLEEMLSEEHIDNVHDLTVSLGETAIRWNIMLISSTLFISLVGLLPYLAIVLESSSTKSFPHGFGFPALRVFGSAVCVTVPQVLIQIRTLTLLKTRLLVTSVDRLAKKQGIKDLAAEINAEDAWDSELAAENFVWAIEKWLRSNSPLQKRDHYQDIKELYEPAHARHLGPRYAVTRHYLIPFLCLILAAGCISTVVGYIGCFLLVRRSQSSHGPILWLGLEVFLSILRIIIWTVNPSFDDSGGISLELHLSNHPPMITCSRFAGEILSQEINAPLQRRDQFLEEVVAYTGPLPVFNVQGVELYYIIAATSSATTVRPMSLDTLSTKRVFGTAWVFATHEAIQSPKDPKCLLIVIYAHKEQTSRILVKKSGHRKFSIYVCSLHSAPGSPVINVKVGVATQSKSHFLTSNPSFMADLGVHYDEIVSRLQSPTKERKAAFGKTWALQPLPTAKNNNLNQAPARTGNWSSMPLTNGELAYINHGVAERRRTQLARRLGEWIDNHVKTYANALEDTPWFTPRQVAGNMDDILRLQQFEAVQKEYLVYEYQRMFENFLMSLTVKWDRDMQKDHAKTVECILEPWLQSDDQDSDNVRKRKLKTWLTDNLENFLEQEAMDRRNSIRGRIATDRTAPAMAKDLEDPHKAAIAQCWDALLKSLSDTPNSPFWHAKSGVEDKLKSELALRFYGVGHNDTESHNFACYHHLMKQINSRFSVFPDVPSISQTHSNIKEDMRSKAVGSLRVLYYLSTFRYTYGKLSVGFELDKMNVACDWFYGAELELWLNAYDKWRENATTSMRSK